MSNVVIPRIDRATLAAVGEAQVARTPATAQGIAASVAYLDSDAAMASLALDAYWPKWNSPWWHMLLLHELGETAQIPAQAVTAMVAAIDALPLHEFPIQPEDWPPGADRARDTACHCALGCMAQVLMACGVDVDRALPWIEPWLVRYQMADGGLNCDEEAYWHTDQCASSMVGTVAAFEAMVMRGRPHPFIDRGAQFLIGRRLTQGSSSAHNAEERAREPLWRQPCFPRFYFYDVLRGLTALVRWAAWSGQPLPHDAVAGAAAHLAAHCPDGVVRVERQPFAEWDTVVPGAVRAPSLRGPASRFALLEATCVIGEPSEALTRAWAQTRRQLIELIDAGQLVG